MARGPMVVSRPANASLHAPPGFTVELYASGLDEPRTMRIAPNGDVFLAESGAGTIRVFHPSESAAKPQPAPVFASGVSRPFGIAFWPPGPNPRFLYVAETERVVRFSYQSGDLKARASPETIVRHLPGGGHWTRDIAFSPDGRHMFVSVGSASNIGTELKGPPPPGIALGAAWGEEKDRADVLEFDPDGSSGHVFAAGLRNCSAEAIAPTDGALWCAVNERDGLGDNLPPDYATVVHEGAFYGWPWYYIGAHPDPRFSGARPELSDHVAVPDVLIQPHSAPLGIAFYDAAQFPAAFRGDAFVTLHGSWNRSQRTGYKVVRLRFHNGKPTGEYEDFLTGFVVSDQAVWGRPVGVAVMHDGALLVSEDGNGTIWRVSYTGGGS
ncbi:MAG: sorbosone dehydrogenase family protein [Acetobacteraceae bacterium]|nr:sorbosone dehydrogenase family protein [Acetobacteraceae bacterium]